MSFEHWLAFVAAYIIISAVPGPSVFMVTGIALTRGLRAALWCVMGDVLGGFVLIALSLAGVGAILAASATAFQAVKWAGVMYMAYLGYCQIRDARKQAAASNQIGKPDCTAETPSGSQGLKAGFLTGVLNPKAIIFYVAFLSQFMEPGGDPLGQFVVLVASSSVIVGGVLSAYAVAAARIGHTFNSPRARRRFGYAGGGFLIGGSVLVATSR